MERDNSRRQDVKNGVPTQDSLATLRSLGLVVEGAHASATEMYIQNGDGSDGRRVAVRPVFVREHPGTSMQEEYTVLYPGRKVLNELLSGMQRNLKTS